MTEPPLRPDPPVASGISGLPGSSGEPPAPRIPPLPNRHATPRAVPSRPTSSLRRTPAGGGPSGDPADDDRAHPDEPEPTGHPTARRAHRPARRRPQHGFRFAAGAAFALGFGLALFGAVRPRGANTTALGIVALPLMVVLAYQVVRPTARRETRFDLVGIMMFGLGLRIIGLFVRFGAPVDALVYHQEGSRIAPALRGLDLGVDTGRPIPGTGWIRYVSGVTHAFVVDDMFVTFVIFTFLSFIGAFLCYRAFVRAIPLGDHRRYALLIFLWPSLVYWPSSIGKEAWMIFGLGVASWGVARITTDRVGIGLVVTIAGLVLLSLVRPHVALMVLVGLGVALLARPTSHSTFRLAGRVVVVIILLVGGSIIVGRTSEVLQVDLTGAEGVTTALEETQVQTDQGGAQFNSAIVRSPLDYPEAFLTVWFRPFPNEVNDAAGLVSAGENIFLLLLVVASWRRLLALPRALIRTPYATYAAAYALVFVYAFSVIANFGILARQRTQGLVLFFVLLCIPAAARRAPRRPGRERAHREREPRRLAREEAGPAAPSLIPDLAPPPGPGT